MRVVLHCKAALGFGVGAAVGFYTLHYTLQLITFKRHALNNKLILILVERFFAKRHLLERG